jgi:hypothetical protein
MTVNLIYRMNPEFSENETIGSFFRFDELVRELCWWVDFFNVAFLKSQAIPKPLISIERINIRSFGDHTVLKHKTRVRVIIRINSAHLSEALWHAILTLLHEVCHCWQVLYGRPSNSWFHNKQYRGKMSEFGILCTENGRHSRIGDPFVFFLKKHGIVFRRPVNASGTIKIPFIPKSEGRSKLKKWTCGCTNIRVAVKDFEAMCLKCGNTFEKVF